MNYYSIIISTELVYAGILYIFCISQQALIEKTNINPGEVGDIVVGNVLAPGSQRATECRMAAFYAGFPGDFTISFAPPDSCKYFEVVF